MASLLSVWAETAEAQRLGDEVDLTEPIRTSTADSQASPVLAFAGDGVVLAFDDRTVADPGTRLVVLEPDGTFRRDVPLHLPYDVQSITCLDADRCLAVVWPMTMAETELRAVRFHLDDGRVDGDDVMTGVMRTTTPRVAAGTDRFFVGVRPATSMLPIHFATGLGAPIALVPTASSSDVACGPTDCLVAWHQNSDPGRGVYAQRFDHAGTTVGGVITIATVTGGTSPGLRVAATGDSYAIILGLSTSLLGWRLAADGTPSARVSVGAGSSVGQMVCDGEGRCLVETGTSGNVAQWQGTSTGSSFSDLDGVLVASGPNQFLHVDAVRRTLVIQSLRFRGTPDPRPSVGTGPDLHGSAVVVAGSDRGYVAVFHRSTGAAWQLVAQPLDAMGNPRAGSGVALRALASEATRLALVATDTQFGLVVLEEDGAASFARLTRAGALDGDFEALGTGRRDASLAWNGTHFLTVVTDSTNAALGQRFDTIGQRVDAMPVALTSPAFRIVAASDGDGFLILHRGTAGIRAMRLGADLTAIDVSPGFVVRDAPVETLALGFDGTRYVAAWSEGTGTGAGAAPFQPRIARIEGGEVLDVGGVNIAPPGDSLDLALSVRPAQSHVVWANRTGESATRYTRIASFSAEGRMGTTREVATSPGRTGTYAVSGVAVASASYGAVIFAQPMSDPDHVPLRMRVRPLSDDGPGTRCTTRDECGGGYCVAGVCCNIACDGACEQCATGTCEPTAAGTECRAASSACDTPEVCDGVFVTCPEPVELTCSDDAGVPPGTDDANVEPGVDAGATSPPDPPPGGCACAVGLGPSSTRRPLLLTALLALVLASARLGRRRAMARPSHDER